jgi:hypothetical protein
MIKEKEDRGEVAWLGAAEYHWGHKSLLKEYAYAVSRHDAKQPHVKHIQMADQMIPMGWACLAR